MFLCFNLSLEMLWSINTFWGYMIWASMTSSLDLLECTIFKKRLSKTDHFCHQVNSFRLIPAANMGEYEPPRERPEDGGLYPLNAEVIMITTNNVIIHHYHHLNAENEV